MSQWVIPGLFGPLPPGSDLEQIPRFAQLERILGCADRSVGPTTANDALAEIFGLDANTARPLATGPLSFLGETGRQVDQWMCCVQPVILQADQDRVLLFQPETNALTKHALQDLIARFNDHFGADGLRLESPVGRQCYLSADSHHGVTFSELEAVRGRNIDSFLPRGPDSGFWRGLLNETQMLLHGLPHYEERVGCELLPINGLWFSGGGELPNGLQPSVHCASGVGLVLAGLCRLTGVALCDLQMAIRQNGLILAEGPSISLFTADVPRWLTEMHRLEAIFANLMARSLTIYSCQGQKFHYRPSWGNFLRRRLNLRDLLMDDQTP